MNKLKVIILLSLVMLSVKSFAQVSCYNIVGYYPSWVNGGNYYINSPSKIDYTKYTHIMYAFAIPGSDGKIGGIDNGAVLTDLVTRAHAKNVKVLLSIGGWLDSSPGNTPFETISGNSTYISNLATACANLVTQYNLDGIDLDWEYPTTKTRWNSLATVLGTKLHGMGKLFTAAVSESAANNGDHYDDVSMLDLVNIMCYGNYNLASSAVAYWTSRGVPQVRRMLGVPFYSADNTTAQHVQKSNLAKTNAGGIMIWDIASEYGDINAIYNTLGNVCNGSTPVPQNLAKGKTAIALSVETGTTYIANNATDGNYTTRWSSDFADPQWVYVDLGATYDINEVKITWEAAYATAFQVQVSADASKWDTLKIVNGNTSTINDLTGLRGTGRYVRVLGTARATAYGYSVFELEVYGNPGQSPYGGTVRTIPGKIEAEDFDTGGEGVAYHDLDASNTLGQYRTTESVDIEGCTDTNGGYDVGETHTSEWLEYTVNVSKAGVYTFQARVATTASGKALHAELDGQNITGTVSIPNTGGWQTWTTVSVTTPVLTAGRKVLRVYMESDQFNLNWVNFALQSEDLATGRKVVASSVETSQFPASYAFDGNDTTRWASAYKDSQWIRVDLDTIRTISQVVLKWEAAYAGIYRIETATDTSSWTIQQRITNGTGGNVTVNFPAVNARYVRVYCEKRATVYGFSLWEVRIPAGGTIPAAKEIAAAAQVQRAVTLSLGAYPNPATGTVHVRVKGVRSPTVLRVYTINGQTVYTTVLQQDVNQLQLDIARWPKGIYIISAGGSQQKLIVQ
jgi:hypothetical protein